MSRYITLSIELHLFFARIMKEHALFLEAGFPLKDRNFIEEADGYKNEFEKLLLDVVNISGGKVRPHILNSGEIVTNYTLSTETKTEELTGIPINKNITLMEQNLNIRPNYDQSLVTEMTIKNINNRAINLLNGLISFKERILNEVLSCKLFTVNYPLLIEHILREAKLYRTYLIALENNQDIEGEDLRQVELFWNQIMMEHALFIRGLLDPTENDLINTADQFAGEYKRLLEETVNMTDATMASITNIALQETLKYRDFKEAGTKGLDSCGIKSIILPLLADHVLREANHYLRLLKN
ncbi:MAG: DUF2935 domain-containing protein [Bacilli bacterium]|nr:DUF2935 domain-containing protein [Bacilli bacterium]MDD4282920.1 DUF2935 domain-containing protein [Bacilli bacterium]MDD4718361.1 DUF2935 domain-containing protein [Bacilli bacterium]